MISEPIVRVAHIQIAMQIRSKYGVCMPAKVQARRAIEKRTQREMIKLLNICMRDVNESDYDRLLEIKRQYDV